MKNLLSTMLFVELFAFNVSFGDGKLPYVVVDTGQTIAHEKSLHGQDADHYGPAPAYRDNGDGTISDLNTGLMWTADPSDKKTYGQAVAGAVKCRVGGYDDWRLPTIKELYSLIIFSGIDPDPRGTGPARLKPFLDTNYFTFSYGRAEDGDRIIDSQYATSTIYKSTTMHGMKTMFGVNFADGRIKGYPAGRGRPRGEKRYYVTYVRGNAEYGKNEFRDNGDGTITDLATGLMWMKQDSGHLKAGPKKNGTMDWQEALKWSDELEYGGYSDWRLPNAKELQSIVDYSRCPDVTDSAAIDPVFETSSIVNEGGKTDFAFYWTGTSHCRSNGAQAAVYIAFGRGLGWMEDPRTGKRQLLDVHGAGCQRSDPKTGDPKQFPYGRGPQGDVVRIYNLVRCIRDINPK